MQKLRNYAFLGLFLVFFVPIFGQTTSVSISYSNGPYCVGSPVTFFGSTTGTDTTWAWTVTPSTATLSTPNSNNTQFTASVAGSYTIVATVSPSGDTAKAILTIGAIPTVTVTPNTDTICAGNTTGVNLIATGTAGATYTWTPTTGLSATSGTLTTATPTVTTTYTVTSHLNGCKDTATSYVAVLPMTSLSITTNKYFVCMGDTTQLHANAPTATSFSWTPGTGLSCTNCPDPIYTAIDTTTYTLTVTGACFNNNTDTVTVNAVICGPPVAGFYASDTVICRYSCITYTDTSIYRPLHYQWYFQGGIPDSSNEQNPTVCYNIESNNSPNGNGMYYTTLIVTDILGQKDTVVDSIKVNISPIANINNNQTYTTIELGNSATLNAFTYSSGATHWEWISTGPIPCTTCNIIDVSPQVNTVYIVKETNAFGCFDYDTILVKVEKICGDVFVPTGFSPNGDGINDRAVVKNNNCIRNIIFAIFDRWGQKVYYTEDVDNKGWDGTYKGEPMDAGVFAYYLKVVLTDNTTIDQKGNITLVR